MLMEDSAKAIDIAIMGGRRRRVAVVVMVARRRGWVGLDMDWPIIYHIMDRHGMDYLEVTGLLLCRAAK